MRGMWQMNNKQFEALRISVAIFISLLFTFLIIFLISDEPINAIRVLLTSPFKNMRTFGNVIELMTPLIFTGLGMLVLFSSKQFNLSADGAFHLGGLAAGLVAIYISMPYGLHPIIAVLLAGVAGSIVALIPFIIKHKTGANEFVVSIMLNYIAVLFASYLVVNFLRDATQGTFATLPYLKTSTLGVLIPKTRVHSGLIVAVLTTIFVYIFLYKTPMGYKIRITGSNKEYADYIGINTVKAIVISQLLGGFICGIGGGIETLGMYNKFTWQNTINFGWDGVIVSILAKNNPKYIIPCAFFLAFIRTGAFNMAMVTDVQSEIISITEGVIIIFVIGEKFLYKLKERSLYKNAKDTLEKELV